MRVLKCTSCDLLMHKIDVSDEYNAFCPQCGTRIIKTSSLSMSGELALCIAALILFIPAQIFALISIDLFSVEIFSTVTNGSLAIESTYPFIAGLIIFCTTFAPLAYLIAIICAHVACHYQHKSALYAATWTIKHFSHWVMIDVFFVSLGIACFKITEIATLSPERGLVSFILLQLLTAILLTRVTPERYWRLLPQPSSQQDGTENESTSSHSLQLKNNLLTCGHCGLTQSTHLTHCCRCGSKVSFRVKQSLQRTWAILIPAIIFIFPANFYPISVLIANGREMEDTIFSGVSLLINQGMYGIAAIIFTASIIVPVAKILLLVYLLTSIHIKSSRGRKQRMKVYRFVHWIGKWSMVDLCVIAIMVSLMDRGNLLDFTPGPGAIAFGLVVVLTMIATEQLDPRLIWDKHE